MGRRMVLVGLLLVSLGGCKKKAEEPPAKVEPAKDTEMGPGKGNLPKQPPPRRPPPPANSSR